MTEKQVKVSINDVRDMINSLNEMKAIIGDRVKSI